jgi:uncharacterized phage-associated protein
VLGVASVIDVAEYILKQRGPMPAMKLQKLCYYSQAWSLVWDDRALFRDRIEAWANGPVAPSLYDKHRGEFTVETVGGDPGKLSDAQRETINAVLGFYGERSSQWLSDLTHSEEPWRAARRGLAPGARGTEEITRASMAEYYGAL